MKSIKRLPVLIFIFVFSLAWTSTTHQKIAVDATKLTPYEMKKLILHYKKEILQGAIDPLKSPKDDTHYLYIDGSYGRAHMVIESRIKSLISSLRGGKISLSEFCYGLGYLSHFLAEVNNPILTGDVKRDGAWMYDYFVTYTEGNIATFSLTFEGYKSNLLEKKDYQGFAIASAIRSARFYEPLKQAYVFNRLNNLGYNFDKLSVPYAVSSLCYNYSVMDTVKVWTHIWKELHGDMKYTPYEYQQ